MMDLFGCLWRAYSLAWGSQPPSRTSLAWPRKNAGGTRFSRARLWPTVRPVRVTFRWWSSAPQRPAPSFILLRSSLDSHRLPSQYLLAIATALPRFTPSSLRSRMVLPLLLLPRGCECGSDDGGSNAASLWSITAPRQGELLLWMSLCSKCRYVLNAHCLLSTLNVCLIWMPECGWKPEILKPVRCYSEC